METPPTLPIKILAIDPGASCGYSILKVETAATATNNASKCEIVEYGFIDVDTSSPYLGDWCIDLIQKINLLETEKGPFDEIGVEDYFFSSRFKQGANVNPAYRTAIHIWAREKNKHYEILNISAWKVFICGRTTPTREQKTKWGAEPSKKLMVVEGLKERFGISFPDYCISKKTKRQIRFRYDIADAVAQGFYMAFLRFNCKEFCSSFNVDEGIDDGANNNSDAEKQTKKRKKKETPQNSLQKEKTTRKSKTTKTPPS